MPGRDAHTAQRGGGRVTVRTVENGPLVAALESECEVPGCRKLTRRFRLVDGLDSVEMAVTLDKLQVRTPEGVHLGLRRMFPAASCGSNSLGRDSPQRGPDARRV